MLGLLIRGTSQSQTYALDHSAMLVPLNKITFVFNSYILFVSKGKKFICAKP